MEEMGEGRNKKNSVSKQPAWDIQSASHFNLISSISKLMNTYGTHKLITMPEVPMPVTMALDILILLNRGCGDEKAQAVCS
jgi:hypothetical protein